MISRKLLAALASGAALSLQAQTIGTFTSVYPLPQGQLMAIPSTHVFQVIASRGDALSAGGTMGFNSDFTGYVPIAGSSENGRLCVNSEFVPGGVTVWDIHFNPTTKLWEVSASQAVDFSPLGNLLVAGTVANCSGEVTPWGTMITCEENDISTDLTGDGYTDWGWNIEIDPVTRQVIDQDGDGDPDKLWAMGRMKHENVKVAPDLRTVYYGDDNDASGMVFKFVADSATKLGSGQLWVLQQSGTTGVWRPVPNTTQADRNDCIALATAAGGTYFSRVEDCEYGPDGKVYFSSTSQGRVFRFNDLGDSIANFEVYVENAMVPIVTDTGVMMTQFNGADNLAFDGEDNLWVTQDSDHRHVWVVRPGHTVAAPQMEVFMNTPINAEPTGITFSPDYRFLFMSIQHPLGNTDAMQDVTGASVVFDRDRTIVIARKENLGIPIGVQDPAAAQGLAVLASYPNPVAEAFHLRVHAPVAGEATLTLMDALGRELGHVQVNLQAGENALRWPTQELAQGSYHLTLRQADAQVTATFVR